MRKQDKLGWVNTGNTGNLKQIGFIKFHRYVFGGPLLQDGMDADVWIKAETTQGRVVRMDGNTAIIYVGK